MQRVPPSLPPSLLPSLLPPGSGREGGKEGGETNPYIGGFLTGDQGIHQGREGQCVLSRGQGEKSRREEGGREGRREGGREGGGGIGEEEGEDGEAGGGLALPEVGIKVMDSGAAFDDESITL